MAFSLASELQKPLQVLRALLFRPKYFWHLAALVIVGDVLLTGLIVNYVSCQLFTLLNHFKRLIHLYS